MENLLLKNKKKLKKVSNYYICEGKIINKKLNIISAGVGNDISFEEEIYSNYFVKKIVLIDPTEISKKIVQVNKNFNFENKALYSETSKVKIYEKKGNLNLSIDNVFATSNFYEVEAVSVDFIKKKYGIESVDILKLDIEGVADKVILDCLKKKNKS